MTAAPGIDPKVAVLMTSCNHAPFVGEQINSIMGQTYVNWHLTVSDDGSTDGSLDVIRRLQGKMPDKVDVVHGPCRGFPYNHFMLANNADPRADYYAWADSDDVWEPDRLACAVKMMRPFGQNEPVLYGNRVSVIDENGRGHGLYPLLNRRPPSFGNALIQVVTAGPTVIFNRPARKLIALDLGCRIPASQDWWAYLVVSGAGGRVIYDPRPTVRYRCHGGNILGSNKGLKAKAARLKSVAKGGFRQRVSANLAALAENEDRLTPENRHALAAAASLHRGEGNAFQRMMKVREAGLCRQSRLQSAFLYVMAALKWF